MAWASTTIGYQDLKMCPDYVRCRASRLSKRYVYRATMTLKRVSPNSFPPSIWARVYDVDMMKSVVSGAMENTKAKPM